MAHCEEPIVGFSARGKQEFFKEFLETQQWEGLRLLPCLAEAEGDGLRENKPHKGSPQPSGSEMGGRLSSSTTVSGSGNRIPVCPFLTALQIPLQPLPQPRCRNERNRISSSCRSSSNSPHCQSGKRLETRRTGVPSVRSPEGVCTCLSAGGDERPGAERVRGRGL